MNFCKQIIRPSGLFQSAVVSVEDSNFTVTEESVTSLDLCPIYADYYFFDIEGIVPKEFVPTGQTINGNYIAMF